MTIWWFLTIISIIAIIPFIILFIKNQWDSICGIFGTFILGFCLIGFLITAIAQPIAIKRTMKRQEKERQQIIYQIEHLTENSDKVKLNEWILSYNDWVNDINTSKEIYGWASWYYSADTSEHTIINLV